MGPHPPSHEGPHPTLAIMSAYGLYRGGVRRVVFAARGVCGTCAVCLVCCVLQLAHIDGNGCGTPPSLEEVRLLQWPHSEWWSDRDRIVLLATYIEYMSNPFMSQTEPGGLAREPPNHLPELGTRAWELEVCDYVVGWPQRHMRSP